MVIGGQQAIIGGFREVGKALPRDIRALGKALDLSLIPRSKLKAANVQIAKEAQAAMVKGWRSRLPRRSSSYRPQARLVKRLGRALASESMVTQTTDRTISFINQATLNSEAKHWYRVNYGAQGPNLAEGRQARSFTASVNGQALFTLRDDTPPAAQSFLPQGFHWRGGAFPTGIFFPDKHSAPANVRGQGVRAARFTDLGVEAVAQRLGPVYFSTLQSYLASDSGNAKGRVNRIRVGGDLRTNRFGTS